MGQLGVYYLMWEASRSELQSILPFLKALRKSKLSESPTRRRSFYNNAFTATKNKSYFIKLVNKTIKEVLFYNFKYIAA